METILFRTGKVAAWAHVDIKTIHNWTRAGKVQAHATHGRQLRFTAPEVHNLLTFLGLPIPEEVQAAVGEPSPRFRVWHIPQIPGAAFRVEVDSPKQAASLLKALADYDRFQFENNIKPDYANAQGLEVFEGGEWVEWSDEDGNEISDILRAGVAK